MNKQAVIESAKELARIVVLAGVSAAISWATTKIGNLPPDSVYALIGTLILRLADKYIHANDNLKANGLVPF